MRTSKGSAMVFQMNSGAWDGKTIIFGDGGVSLQDGVDIRRPVFAK